MICNKCKRMIVMNAFCKTECNKCASPITTGHMPGYTICKKCSSYWGICEQCGKELTDKEIEVEEIRNE